MPKTIQIRNVPEKLHKQLKMRAAKRGKSLSSLLVEMAAREMETPDIEEFLELVKRVPPETSDFDATAFIRRQRDSR